MSGTLTLRCYVNSVASIVFLATSLEMKCACANHLQMQCGSVQILSCFYVESLDILEIKRDNLIYQILCCPTECYRCIIRNQTLNIILDQE